MKQRENVHSITAQTRAPHPHPPRICHSGVRNGQARLGPCMWVQCPRGFLVALLYLAPSGNGPALGLFLFFVSHGRLCGKKGPWRVPHFRATGVPVGKDVNKRSASVPRRARLESQHCSTTVVHGTRCSRREYPEYTVAPSSLSLSLPDPSPARSRRGAVWLDRGVASSATVSRAARFCALLSVTFVCVACPPRCKQTENRKTKDKQGHCCLVSSLRKEGSCVFFAFAFPGAKKMLYK